MRYLFIVALLLIPTVAKADGVIVEAPIIGNDEVSFRDKEVESFTYEDGCKVTNNLEDPKVLNPEDCPDKDLVKYLNCGDTVVSRDDRPEECK